MASTSIRFDPSATALITARAKTAATTTADLARQASRPNRLDTSATSPGFKMDVFKRSRHPCSPHVFQFTEYPDTASLFWQRQKRRI
jgi:hypothetical protein